MDNLEGLWKNSSVIIESPSNSQGWLYLGNIKAAQEYNLAMYQITAVLTANQEAKLNYSDKIKHLKIDLQDVDSQNIIQHFDQSIQFIAEQLESTNVLVHCMVGVSRSVTLVVAYLMKTKRMTYKQAMEYVKVRRSIAMPNDGFKKQLLIYEQSLNL